MGVSENVVYHQIAILVGKTVIHIDSPSNFWVSIFRQTYTEGRKRAVTSVGW